MCWACQEGEMLAAYREYLAQRKAAQAADPPITGSNAAEAKTDDDWAKGAWFAAKADRNE